MPTQFVVKKNPHEVENAGRIPVLTFAVNSPFNSDGGNQWTNYGKKNAPDAQTSPPLPRQQPARQERRGGGGGGVSLANHASGLPGQAEQQQCA